MRGAPHTQILPRVDRTGPEPPITNAVHGHRRDARLHETTFVQDGIVYKHVPDIKTFERLVRKSTMAELLEQLPDHLRCPVTKRPLSDAVVLPCCEETIGNFALLCLTETENVLDESGPLRCGRCKQPMRVDDVVANLAMRELVCEALRDPRLDEVREGARLAAARRTPPRGTHRRTPLHAVRGHPFRTSPPVA